MSIRELVRCASGSCIRVSGLLLIITLPSSSSAIEHYIARGDQDVTVYGAAPDTGIWGQQAIGAGDLNNDGIGDLVIGVPLVHCAVNPLRRCGNVYVFFGPLISGMVADLATDAADVTVVGSEQREDLLGGSIAVTDVNSDGIDDLIMGADNAETPRGSEGAVFILLGPLSAGSIVDLETMQADVEIYGQVDGFGQSLAHGDMDQDGAEDLVIGAPTRLFTTKTIFIVFGPFSSGMVLDLSMVSGLAMVQMKFAGGGFNSSLVAGDVSGDGHDDLVVRGYDLYPEVYVLFSPIHPGTLVDLGTTPADTMIAGIKDLGSSLALGDIDGDGAVDLAMGDPRSFGCRDGDCGTLHIAFGPLAQGTYHNLRTGPLDVTIIGAIEDSRFGDSVAIGDFSNDGVTDIAVGAPDRGAQGNESGTVYIINGPFATGTVIELDQLPADVMIHGKAPEDWLGTSVELADVSGDGNVDLLLGAGYADGADGQREDAGEAYVFLNDAARPAPVANRLFIIQDTGMHPHLQWDSYIPDPSVTHYNVYRFDQKGLLPPVPITQPVLPAWTDGMAPGSPYFYSVRAVNAAGESRN